MKLTTNPLTTGLTALAGLLLACCSEDSLPSDTSDSRSVLLQVSTLQATGISGTATRAVTTSDYPTNQSIGFFLKEDAGAGYTARDNYKGEYNTARALWVPASGNIWLSPRDADIAVYAPYDVEQTTPATLNLTSCLRPADGSKDIWCKRFTASNRDANLAVTLEHIYTRLTLTVSRSEDYKAEAGLTDLVLEGNEIHTGGTYRIFEDAPYTYNADNQFNVSPARQTLNEITPTATYDMLLIPTATLTEGITLTLTIDGEKMRVVVPKEKFASTSGALEAGKQYNINLKLVPGKLDLYSVSVMKWDVQDELDAGNVVIEIGIKVPESEINLGGTNCTAQDKKDLSKLTWAPGNLRQTNDDGSGPTIFAGPTEYGHYYTWFSDYTGDTTSTRSDPCFTLDASTYGTGWRTPTKNELEKLTRCCADGNSVFFDNGKWFMNRTGLFLPAAGNRAYGKGSGTIPYYEAGHSGGYWCSDDKSNEYEYYRYYLNLFPLQIESQTMQSGFSVRCVKGEKQ